MSVLLCVLLLGRSQFHRDHFPFKQITKGDFYSQAFGVQLSGGQGGGGGGWSVNYQFLQQQLESLLPGWNYWASYRKCEKEGEREPLIWQLLKCGGNFIKMRCQCNVSPPLITGDCDLSLMEKGTCYNPDDCTGLSTSSPRAPWKGLAASGQIVFCFFL